MKYPKIKVKQPKCRYCGKSGNILYYVIADDLEHPVPYHKKCYKKFRLGIFIEIAENIWNTSTLK